MLCQSSGTLAWLTISVVWQKFKNKLGPELDWTLFNKSGTKASANLKPLFYSFLNFKLFSCSRSFNQAENATCSSHASGNDGDEKDDGDYDDKDDGDDEDDDDDYDDTMIKIIILLYIRCRLR